MEVNSHPQQLFPPKPQPTAISVHDLVSMYIALSGTVQPGAKPSGNLSLILNKLELTIKHFTDGLNTN